MLTYPRSVPQLHAIEERLQRCRSLPTSVAFTLVVRRALACDRLTYTILRKEEGFSLEVCAEPSVSPARIARMNRNDRADCLASFGVLEHILFPKLLYAVAMGADRIMRGNASPYPTRSPPWQDRLRLPFATSPAWQLAARTHLDDWGRAASISYRPTDMTGDLDARARMLALVCNIPPLLNSEQTTIHYPY